MATLWFWIVAAMLAAYAVLDGFDLGAGAIYLFAAKTDDERRRCCAPSGPCGTATKSGCWRLAARSICFPLLYASSFSGFYLPLMMVLWLLMLRGIGIEFRAHIDNPVWREFFDVVFAVSSMLLCVFLRRGAGQRGARRSAGCRADISSSRSGRTSGSVRETGILDWYTVFTGVMALVTLTAHGSHYIALKTDEDLGRRARGLALLLWPAQFFLTCVALVVTYFHTARSHGEL